MTSSHNIIQLWIWSQKIYKTFENLGTTIANRNVVYDKIGIRVVINTSYTSDAITFCKDVDIFNKYVVMFQNILK
jgi:hypothetical protein